MDRYEMMEKARREGSKGLLMYLEAEEYGDNLALELGKKAGEERRKNIALQGLTPEQAQQALGYYREYFADRGLYENELYPGIAELLRTLQQAGYVLIVATSKPEEFTHTILRHFQLDSYFSFVGGNTLDERRPTKAAVIAYIRERFPDITGENTLMIGDRCYDIEGAHACGLPAVGVLYGYGSRQELEAAGADELVQTPAALLQSIRRRLPR